MKLKSKKTFGVFLSLAVAVCIAVPGTLAVEAGTDVSGSSISIGEGTEQKPENIVTLPDADSAPEETMAPTDAGSAPEETVAPTDAGSAPEETVAPSDAGHASDNQEAPAGDADAVAGEAPDETGAPPAGETCTCGSNNGIHTVQCPLYEASAEPEALVHIEGCSDQCDGTDCECECHQRNLFERLMACEHYEELWEILEAASEEELMALTAEQRAQIEEKILALEPQPLPEVVIQESSDVPVVSEIIYPTVNFTNVAPFGSPVVG